jgi:transmembrane sensor
MKDPRSKLERATSALRHDVWDDLQHRRIGKRLDEALAAPRSASGRRRLAGALAAVAVAAVVAVVAFRPASEPAPQTQLAHAPQRDSARTVFSDGSLVDVDRGGQIQVVSDRAEETRIEVLSGRAEFEVQKRPNRPFIAAVRGVEVRVIGTHFSAELDESHVPAVVRVVVSRGVVEVVGRAGEHVARLNAGDRIEVSLAPPAASAVATPSAASELAAPAEHAAAAPADAAKLFETALDARRAGDTSGAVKAYAALLKQFPNDSRAGVAALELGRLRMDSQHAYGPAADAFRRAIAAAPNDGIREDALARLVEAVDAMGNQKACLAEQQRYLARYPSGVHAASVRGRCAAR